MFNRYRDYVPLWTHDTPAKRPRNLWYWAIVISSVALNTVLLCNLFRASGQQVCPQTEPCRDQSCPEPVSDTPLDNYQRLDVQPLVDGDSVNHLLTSENAVVTTLYTDAYALAVVTLGHSLNQVNSTARRIVLYLPEQVSPRALCIATSSGFDALPVARIDPPEGVNERFLDQYTKLRLWTLDQHGIKSVVYLDADTLVLGNFDELFSLPYTFAAVPDIFLDHRGFILSFNAGVLFLRPSTSVFEDMLTKVGTAEYPRHMAEQAFLNLYYAANAVRLPYVYNANLAIKSKKVIVWEDIWTQTRIVHYTLVKPFLDDADWSLAVEIERMDDVVNSKIGNQWGGLFDPELEAWARAWRDTRRTYEDAWATCKGLAHSNSTYVIGPI
ncbi:glycosyltransferase family 8 protein [Gelatoporia subvermispora B]|uniref:Glycosyltransferase family 8 protein n=1 Tax=Ceriporiopsis subvermispora (strain B) TaxID=914234 RepID=M2QLD1_CERS8|nr:glycosyltransferase family 8 protein [Gelatoporia subvermispora B]